GAGETVTLNIEIGDGDDDAPDLSPLTPDFVVLGTSTNHSLSIVNGRREAHTILGIALRPRREGRLTIPPLAIGGQRTQPLALDVTASADPGGGAADRPVVLEGKADPSQAYVGQQIDYTLRLYFAVNLADGQLADPSAEGAEIRRVGQDANYQSMRGGRRFNVVERHYAIFPQHAGSLAIKPPSFQGTAVDPTDAGSFFGAGSPVNAVAEVANVQVRARPAGAADGAWIPARELKLSLDGVPPDGKARVGQPVTLTMRLDATGMPFEALPALSLPTIDGADVYPDKAVTGGGVSGPWITGRREQGFAVVPTRPGTLHIPATTLHWWNVVTDKAEVATLPAHDIEVATASGAAAPAAPASAAPRGQAVPAANAAGDAAPAGPVAAGMPWRWLFFGALALWVLTVVAWIVLARRRAAPTTAAPVAVPASAQRERPAREAFLKSASSGDAASAERALLSWARIVRPSVRSLGALAALLDAPQRAAIEGLQRARFAGGELDRAALRDAFAKGFAWTPATQGDQGDGLPPLYPH
ncbi:MAG: BatD family protein, partial [Luteibacter sp.]